MKRLHQINLVGILTVAVMCIFQWQANRRLNLEITRLERTRLDQASNLQQQEGVIRGMSADLESFRDRFARADSDYTNTVHQLAENDRQRERLTRERDQLKEGITNWVHAVALRDERLKEANLRLAEFADQLSQQIRQFNELATNYQTAMHTLGERTRNFNDLVEKYNALVQPAGDSNR
jgi:DNA repair exonuclease SbcCD ATPase subunit